MEQGTHITQFKLNQKIKKIPKDLQLVDATDVETYGDYMPSGAAARHRILDLGLPNHGLTDLSVAFVLILK